MSQYELNRSITMAVDASDEIISLQELLEIALEQIDHPKKECRQSRTVLLLQCYLDRVKPHLEELRQELKEFQQLVNRPDGGQMNGTHGAGLAAERV